MEKIIIVGAGLVGSLLSIYLARAGFKVHIYERHQDPRQNNRKPGRSINITLCERGFHALDKVGLGNSVREFCIPVYGRTIHAQNGELTYQPYGNNREAIYSIERGQLSGILLNFVEAEENIKCHFNQKCLDIDLPTTTLKLCNSETGEISQVQGERIFAADGAYSIVRQKMQRLKRFNYSQEYLDQGYKEIIIPARKDGNWALDKNSLHIWPRDNFMLIGFPNLDGSFTLSLHLPYEGTISHNSVASYQDLYHLFKTYFLDVLPLVESSLKDYFNHPPEAMITIKCYPWTYQDKVALIGDASHAIFPSYGQGANSGFEDCQVFQECLEKHPGNWRAIFKEYETLRKPNTDAIADLCIEHFTILRKLVGDPKFILKSKIERKLQELYPNYASLYHNISFTCMPYLEALNLEQMQQSIINKIAEIDQIEDKLNNSNFQPLLSNYVQD